MFLLAKVLTGDYTLPLFCLQKGDGMDVLNYIVTRKKEILRMLEIDRKIGADPYDNVARLKELKKVEKIINQNSKTGERLCGINQQKKS